jgi:hypothetical protein
MTQRLTWQFVSKKAVLSEPAPLRAMFDVGYFPQSTPSPG